MTEIIVKLIKLRIRQYLQLKKADDKEMMADVASVISLLIVSDARLQQIMEAKEKDCVFRQITTHCYQEWPDKHSLRWMPQKPTGSTSGTLCCTEHTAKRIQDRHSLLHMIRNPCKDP